MWRNSTTSAVSFRGILYPLMAEEPRHPGGVGTGVGHGHLRPSAPAKSQGGRARTSSPSPLSPFRSNICT